MQFSLDTLKNQSSFSSKKNELSVKSNQSALSALKSGKVAAQSNATQISKKVDTYAASVIDKTTEVLRTSKTDLVFIIDKSGSCEGLEGATCAGYNSLIEKEKKTGFHTLVTTVLFDEGIDLVVNRKDINDVSSLCYRAQGGTALYDTLYDTIMSIKSSQANDSIKSTKTVVAIMTDGEDEHSKYHSLSEVRSLIKQCLDEGWEFIFFGALKNAQGIASSLGIDKLSSIEVDKSQEGMYNNFVSVSNALDDLRNYGKLTDNWSRASKKTQAIETNDDVKMLGLKK